MRTFHPPSCLTFLNAGSAFHRAQLLTITLWSGVVIQLCEWDTDITCDMGTFSHSGPSFKRSNVTYKKGLDVDQMSLYIYPRPTDLVSGATWFDLFRSGGLDYATVQLDIMIFDTSSPPVQQGYYNWFYGVVSDIPSITALGAEITVKSQLTRLDIQMPRNLIQPGCPNTLFDRACSFNNAAMARSNWAINGTIQYVNPEGNFNTSIPANADNDYYTQGRLVVTSGQNANAVRKIKQSNGADVYLFAPLYYTPQIGDGVTLYPGCDKTQPTCVSKFSNGPNFKGMRFVPIPSAVL